MNSIALIFCIYIGTAFSSREVMQEVPVQANTVADSVGINVHLHHGDTIYRNFSLVKNLLVGLGVHHIRDGLIDTTWQPYYQEHIALGRLGIKGVFITSPAQSEDLLASWPIRVPGAFEGYEAPNEYDNSGDPNWIHTLGAFLPVLQRAAQAEIGNQHYPIIGPSLINAANFPLLTSLSSTFDYSNMHNYFAGRNPGTPGWGPDEYGSIGYNMRLVNASAPGHAVITTETGYQTGSSTPQGIPEDIEGIYAPRVILEQARRGVTRTYLYELIDEDQAKEPGERTFGLAHGDGTPKFAYMALKNLIALLSDHGTSPAHATRPLNFTLVGATSDVHHLLMARQDGSFQLALWIEGQDWEPDKHLRTPSTERRIIVQLTVRPSKAEITQFHPNGSITQQITTAQMQIPLLLSGAVTVLHLR